jgi:hypothetical protein
MRPALLSLLLLAACGGPGGKRSSGEGPAGPDLQIVAHLDGSSADPVEGGLGLFSVSVRNVSKRCAILRDLALPDGSPILTWENPPARPLEYDSRADEYRAESGPRTAGEAVHIGLLLPGESVLFRPHVRLLNLPRRFVLTYHSYSVEEVAQYVYFEVQGGGPLRYRRMAPVDVAEIIPVKEAAATHRAVIFPYGYSPTMTPRTAELLLNVEAAPRRFRLADALMRASIAATDVEESTFCVYLDAWAVRTRGRTWLISPRATTPLPRLTRFELCFFYLDTIETHLPAQFEFTGALDVRFPDLRIVPMRDAQDRSRKLAFIQREDLPSFLKEVAEKGLEVEVRAEGRAISLVLRTEAPAGAPTIPFADALKKAGIAANEIVEHLWSEALGAWVIRTKARSWRISDRGAGGLPAIPWFAFFFRKLDERAAAGDVKFIIPAEDIDAFDFAPAGAVKKADLGRFLTLVFERGLTIEVAASDREAAFRLKK